MLYNDWEVKPGTQNNNSWIVGVSDCGVRTDESLKLVKMQHKCKEISLYQSATVCDSYGNCASWGLSYYTENVEDEPTETEGDVLMHLQKNQRVESPFLVFDSNKYIRKVSCGMGFTLMLSSLGELWSMGFNKFGQLGLSHFNSTYENT